MQSPYFLHRLGKSLLPMDASLATLELRTAQTFPCDGPCQILIRDQIMPITCVDLFDYHEAYELGLAERYLGYLLDCYGATPQAATMVYRRMAIAADAYMAQYRAGKQKEPYAPHIFVQHCGELNRDIRSSFPAWVKDVKERLIPVVAP